MVAEAEKSEKLKKFDLEIYGKEVVVSIEKVEKNQKCKIETHAGSSCGCVDGRDIEYIIKVEPKKNIFQQARDFLKDKFFKKPREVTEFPVAGGSHGLAEILGRFLNQGDMNSYVAEEMHKLGFIPNVHVGTEDIKESSLKIDFEDFFNGSFTDETAKKKLAEILENPQGCGWNSGYQKMYGKNPEFLFIKSAIKSGIDFVMPVLGKHHEETSVDMKESTERVMGADYDVEKFVVGVLNKKFKRFLKALVGRENVIRIQNALIADAVFTATRLTRTNIAKIPKNDQRYEFIERILNNAGTRKGEENWNELQKIRDEMIENKENLDWVGQKSPA
ncbi:MAG: hypothetical protein Fur0024_0250 [Patescibacteria group bacterium]